MVCDGTLSKMKTREKKFEPIALHVNSVHHVRDPVSYPWQWSWKDVSTKVQNMRHQYALVKQKIKKQEEEFDWMEGITHWSNFLRYKEVFGDVSLVFTDNDGIGGGYEGDAREMDIIRFGQLGQVAGGGFVGGIDGVENGVMDLEFDYDGEEGEDNYTGGNKSDACMREDAGERFVCESIEPISSDTRKKRKVCMGMEKKAWGCLLTHLGQLKEMEARCEQRDMDRERERLRREQRQIEMEKERERKWEEMEKDREVREKNREKFRRKWIQEWEAMEGENEERERRRDEELRQQREWEERLKCRRSEWKKRMDDMLSQHRAEMGQIQARIIHDQQNLTSQFIGVVSQWTGHTSALSDHTGASSHYMSQMMQNLHHVNGMVHGDARVEGDNQEDQFIVDG